MDQHGPRPQTSAAAQALQAARRELLSRLDPSGESGPAPLDFDRLHADIMDAYFRDRLQEIRQERESPLPDLALVAQGGYGRSEMCPASDVDILLLFPETVPAEADELARAVFFPLWDLGLDLGHGVRTVRECLEVAAQDFQVFACLLDVRFLAGDPGVLAALVQAFSGPARAGAGAFQDWLARRNQEREASFGDATALLEPDLKNGLGALRDAQQVFWLCRALGHALPEAPPPPFTAADMAALDGDYRLVLRARTALHAVARRKQDRLYLELQPQVARLMGFQDGPEIPAVEQFLADLHRALRRIRDTRAALFRELDAARLPEAERAAFPRPCSPEIMDWPEGLRYAPPATLALKAWLQARDQRPGEPVPDRVLEQALALFLVQSRCGRPLGWSARRLAEDFFRAASGAVAPGPGLLDLLCEVLGGPHGFAAALEMLETEALAALIPEFGRVQNLVQFDAYHLHPLGVHTLDTVRGVLALGQEAAFREAFARVGDPRVLILAALFHDIGKDGQDHARRGAGLAREILARFGLDPSTLEDVVFLVENHLLLPVAAGRADLGDETQVGRLAVAVGSSRRLDMLALLSVADARATGPKAWNDWTASLLAELTVKVSHLLAEGPFARPHAAHRILTTRDKVRAKARGLLDPDFVEHCLNHMPQRYVLTHPAGEIVGHLELVREMREEIEAERTRRPGGRAGVGTTLIRTRELPAAGCHQAVFAATDQPGLFASIAGAFALHDMNVLAANIFTFSDATVLDIFTVSSPPDSLYAEEAFARVRRSVRYALTGKLSMEERLAEKRRSLFTRKAKGTGRPPRVSLDNEASDFFTLVEVRADDRPGLLYDVLSVLCKLGVDIHAAKVGTKVDRVSDVFSIREATGGKITNPERMAEIRKALVRALRETPTA